MGSSFNLLENLQVITIGEAVFSLPEIQEIRESLGGEGNCISVGYSLISTPEDNGLFKPLYYFYTNRLSDYLFLSSSLFS